MKLLDGPVISTMLALVCGYGLVVSFQTRNVLFAVFNGIFFLLNVHTAYKGWKAHFQK